MTDREETPLYPKGTVRALLDGEHVTRATRDALMHRMNAWRVDESQNASPFDVSFPPESPHNSALHDTLGTPLHFFDNDALRTLRAICARLVPDSVAIGVDIAAQIDARLASKRGNGWRFDIMPPDGEAYARGVSGINESATHMFGAPFVELEATDQNTLLQHIQDASVSGGVWDTLSAQRFFEELNAESAELFYSHPLAQESIGYAGMADVPGWTKLGLNNLEDREPRPIRNETDDVNQHANHAMNPDAHRAHD